MIRNMWKRHGLDRGDDFRNFYQRGVARDCLWNHFVKIGQARKPYQEDVEKLWSFRGHQFLNFRKHGLSRHCLWDHFGKSKVNVKHLIRNM